MDTGITPDGVEEVQGYFERSKNSLIMMIDDEPLLMEVIQIYLEEQGYTRFLQCADSTQALDMIGEHAPDVILLDLVMPEVTGFDILSTLRNHVETRYLPVVVLTSSSDSETMLEALKLGATDFLSKPVDSSELSLRLRNTLTVKAYQDRLTFFDQVTGLPNRRLLLERIRRYFRRDSSVSLLLIGLNRFKVVNDTLGPAAGDEVLSQFSGRLQFVVERFPDDRIFLARFSGDEFAVLVSSDDESEALLVAENIHDECAEPFIIEKTEKVHVTSGIGLATLPAAHEADDLVRLAGVAQKLAKQKGQDAIQVYTPEIDSEAREILRMENDLRSALEKEEFELYLQPKLAAHSRKVAGFEVLLRWFRNGEMVSPFHFIPVAEELGIIVPIGDWVIREACRHTRKLADLGHILKVSINVSAPQLAGSSILETLNSAMEESSLLPESIVVEITESIIMDDVEEKLNALHKIRAQGVALSIDDFGTGYSSLNYLKRFPINELKIDRSFLMGLPDSEEDAAITRAIIALAHNLGLAVTAEGVETEAQANFLSEHDCELFQGFLFSKPLPIDDFIAYVEATNN